MLSDKYREQWKTLARVATKISEYESESHAGLLSLLSKFQQEYRIAEFMGSTEVDRHLATFIEEKCLLGIDHNIQSSILHSSYKNWCWDNAIRPLNAKKFKLRLEQLGIFSIRKAAGMFFENIDIKKAMWP